METARNVEPNTREKEERKKGQRMKRRRKRKTGRERKRFSTSPFVSINTSRLILNRIALCHLFLCKKVQQADSFKFAAGAAKKGFFRPKEIFFNWYIGAEVDATTVDFKFSSGQKKIWRL